MGLGGRQAAHSRPSDRRRRTPDGRACYEMVVARRLKSLTTGNVRCRVAAVTLCLASLDQIASSHRNLISVLLSLIITVCLTIDIFAHIINAYFFTWIDNLPRDELDWHQQCSENLANCGNPSKSITGFMNLLLFDDLLSSLISQHNVWSEITSHNVLPLKRDQFIALFVGPCWPWHDGHEISRLYHSLSWYIH